MHNSPSYAQPANASSTCFIRCFYRTVLGPRAGQVAPGAEAIFAPPGIFP